MGKSNETIRESHSEADRFAGMFPERLRRLRDGQHMKRGVLADLCGVSRNTIWRYESGEAVPTAEILITLADIFDTSTDYMLGRTNNPGRIR